MRSWCFLAVVLMYGCLGSSQEVISSTENCRQNDFSPCTCRTIPAGEVTIEVTCKDADFPAIQTAFNRASNDTLKDIMKMHLTVQSSELPADIFGDKRINFIELICPPSSINLKIHKDAFRSSKSYNQVFQIRNCDMSQLDFTFIEDFDNLHTLSFQNILGLTALPNNLPRRLVNLSISNSLDFRGLTGFPSELLKLAYLSFSDCPHFSRLTIPTNLPSVKSLKVINCPTFRQWELFCTSFTKLEEIYMHDAILDDDRTKEMFEKILSCPTSETMRSVSLLNNRLTRIPEEISSLPNLEELYLDNNNITSIQNLNLKAPKVTIISITGNKLQKIEAGAFQGQFQEAKVDLRRNSLNLLDSSVFRSMLEQMSPTGQLLVYHNPIACEDCRMAWLMRDHRQLLSHLTFFPLCSNGSDFMDLNPEGYSKCQTEEIIAITTEKSMPSIILDFVEPTKVVPQNMDETKPTTEKMPLDFVAHVVPQNMDDSISMASVEPDNDNNRGNNAATTQVTLLFSPLICCVILALSFCYFEVFSSTK